MHDDLVDVGRLIHDRLLHSFGAVFFAVRSDQQALETSQHIEEIILRDVTHVARVEPPVAHGFGRGPGILPVAGHDVLAAGNLAALLVEDLQVQRNEYLARRSEPVPVMFGRVGRNHGRRLRKSVSLEHRDSDGVEKPLQLRVEQRTAPDEELEVATERLPHLAEQQRVENPDDGGQHDAPSAAPAIPVAVVCVCRAEREVEKRLGESPLGPYGAFDVFPEVLGQRRDRQQEVRLHLADVLRDVLERLHRRRSDLHRGHRGSAGDHDVETHDVGETVVERQDDQRAEMRRNVDPRQRLLDVGRVVAVGQDHAFGVRRRARGVGDRGVIVIPDRLPDLHELLLVLGEVFAAQTLERPVGRLPGFQRNVSEDDHLLQLRQSGADAADLGQLVFRHENGLDLGVPHAEEEVVRLFEFHRQGHADRPGVEQPQFGNDPCVAAFGQYRHLVSGADAERGESGSGFERLLAGLGIGRRLEFVMAFFEQEGLGPVFPHGGLEEVDDGLFHGS